VTVFVLTCYDPAASYGYTEVFFRLDAAMRYAGVKGWQKRGSDYTWTQQEKEVRVREKHGLISWTEDTAVYKIRRKRVRGRP